MNEDNAYGKAKGRRYTPSQVEVLRAVPMRDILAYEGLDTSHTNGGLFFSPFRDREHDPSLHIDDVRHRWYDHGGAALCCPGPAGGDTVSFVMRLKGLSFVGALDYLCRFCPGVVPDIEPVTVPLVRDRIVGGGAAHSSSTTRILSASERFTDRSLVSYAASRGIPSSVLEAACRQLEYEVSFLREDGATVRRVYRSIGFRNSVGGWVSRYPARTAGKGKRTIGAGGPSLLDSRGTLVPLDGAAASFPSVVIFEGFMDYLSWLAKDRPACVPGDTDCIVLNSVSNVRQAEAFVVLHANIICLLDADAAGDAATEAVRAMCSEAGRPRRFFDRRDLLLGCKDYNEMWMQVHPATDTTNVNH